MEIKKNIIIKPIIYSAIDIKWRINTNLTDLKIEEHDLFENIYIQKWFLNL